MERANDLFKNASVKYEEICDIINHMCKMLNDAGANFSVDIAISQFDLILQSMLLKVSLADGEYHDFEKQFIDKITDHSDLFGYLKLKTDTGTKITWETLDVLTPKSIKILISDIDEELEEIFKAFIVPFALVDNALEFDFLAAIRDRISGIMAFFSMIDGDSDDNEVETASDVLCQFSILWNNVIDVASKAVEKSAPSKENSLKCHYEILKKN